PAELIAAYRRLAEKCDYPLHLGVTEAGPMPAGGVKSAVGIGPLRADGIGDTIGVSLTDDPVEEVKVGNWILQSLGLKKRGLDLVACPSCGRAEVDVLGLTKQVNEALEREGLKAPIRVAVMGGVVNGPGKAREADLVFSVAMRMSKLFVRTLREAPAEAEIASHQLLLRAAFIRKVMAGAYSWLPLGWRTLRKVEQIVREEMNASEAQEIRMPIILPAEPWKVTGRWQTYGDLMFKLKDRHDRDLGLGPPHDEVVTPLVAGEFASYRDLPVNLYQIEWKYRDVLRPGLGPLRGPRCGM